MEWGSIIQIVANIATSAGIIILIKQLYIYNKQTMLSEADLKLRLEYQKREKAGEMAKEFAAILNDIGFVLIVLKENNTHKFLKAKRCLKLKYFDIEELREIFEEEKEIIDEIKTPKINLKKLLDMYEVIYWKEGKKFNKERKVLEKMNFKKHEKEDTDEKKYENEIYDDVRKKLLFIFEEKRINCLNILEYIAMNFCTEIADADIAYNSLHQLFLDFVKANFFFIAHRNSKGGKDRFYINLIELYNLWSEKFMKAKQIEEQKKQEILREKRAKITSLKIDKEIKK